MLKISHRGGKCLENTMFSFKSNFINSMKRGVKHCIELDLQLTKDNHLVILHDDSLNRTTTGYGNVRSKTLLEIQSVTITEHLAPGEYIITSETIPTLFDFLQWLHFIEKNNDMESVVILDIKQSDDYELIIRLINQLMHFYFTKTKIIIGLWSMTWVQLIKDRLVDPFFEIMLITDDLSILKQYKDNLLIDYLSLDINLFKSRKGYCTAKKLIKDWKNERENRKIITWTVNKRFDYFIAKWLICSDGIISDL